MIPELKLIMDGVETKRFHTTPMHREETVGHHQGLVCALLTVCYPHLRKEVLQYASLHDMAECITGDGPAPSKRGPIGSVIKQHLDLLEDEVFDQHKTVLPELTADEYNALKRCDYVAGMITCHREYVMGNRLIREQFSNFWIYYTELIMSGPKNEKLDSFAKTLARIVLKGPHD